MHVLELGQAAAIFTVAVGLSLWRVKVATGPALVVADRALGLCTAISACWVLAACVALETSAFYL